MLSLDKHVVVCSWITEDQAKSDFIVNTREFLLLWKLTKNDDEVSYLK